jgi:FMN phosphatase YigB (HAD superfamily)
MIKNILFDIDGLVVKREMYFSTRFLQDYGVPEEKIQKFFHNEFKACIIGNADLKVEIAKYLESWGWNKSVDELLQYWFEFESETDKQILRSVKELREKGIHCYLQTKNEKYRCDYLWNVVGLKNHFDGIFASYELRCKKPEKEFWEIIWQKLKTPDKQEILVWDNEEAIIQSAKDFGFQAEVYTSFEEYTKQLKSFLEL